MLLPARLAEWLQSLSGQKVSHCWLAARFLQALDIDQRVTHHRRTSARFGDHLLFGVDDQRVILSRVLKHR